jgi:hypothetical protein
MMLTSAEKAYCLALLALKHKEFRKAVDLFEEAAPGFENNQEFNLLWETTRLLVAVRDELKTREGGIEERIQIEEVYSYGQEDELR